MKLKYYLGLVGVLLVSIFMNLQSVWAHTLTTVESTYYYVRQRDDGSGRYPGTLKEFTLDGKTAYCIEPGVPPGTTDYSSGQWEHSSLDEKYKKLITLYAYYGYDYPGHQDIKYRAATQALIWEAVLHDGSKVKYYNGNNGTGGEIDISAERAEIVNLVNDHNKLPAFANSLAIVSIGNTAMYEDTAKIVDQFSWSYTGQADVEIREDILYITPVVHEDFKIYFKKNPVYESQFQIYHSASSQDVIVAGEGYPVSFTVDVECRGVQIFIEKLDADTMGNKPQGDATLEGAVYVVYRAGYDIVDTIVTDSEGRAHTHNSLPMDYYYIKEISPSRGYELDDTEYEVYAYTAKEFTVQVKENVIKQKIKFVKVFTSASTGIMQGENGIMFALYDNKNNLIKTYTTGSDGSFEDTIVVGSYVLKQLTVAKGYEKMPDYYFEVRESGDKTYVFADALIEARLKVVKKDYITHENLKLANVKFKIFDVKNNQYVKQRISLTNPNLTDVFVTNEDGILITPWPLEYGTYILEEVDSIIPNFSWNKEKITFTIDENSHFEVDNDLGNIIVVEFYNKPVLGQVSVVKKGSYLTYKDGVIQELDVPLGNVKYGLYAREDIYNYFNELVYHKGQLIKEIYTNEDGTFTIEGLYLGAYYLQELETVDNYVLDNKKYEFDIEYIDQYTEVVVKDFSFTNKSERGIFTFLKVDSETKEPLEGVLIEIYDEFDNLVYQGTTDKEGKIVLELPFGNYYLIEVEPLLGYEIDNEKHEFTVSKDNIEENFVLENSLIPKELKIEVPDTFKNIKHKSNMSLLLICFILVMLNVKKRIKIN